MIRRSVKPARRLLRLLMAPLFIALVQSSLPLMSNDFVDAQATIGDAWLISLVIIIVIAFADWLSARKKPALKFERHCKDILSIHRWADVTLTVTPEPGNAVANQAVQIRELTSPSLETSQNTLPVELQADKRSSIDYRVRANTRGDAEIYALDMLKDSPLGLWQSVWREELITSIKVYPDFEAIQGYKLLAADNHVSQLGIRRLQRRGEGMEFHQLREYQHGDSSRQIDWKASARKQKIISREYQDERDQQIIVLLDNGRRMRSEDQQLGHLDHAVNAMALLSHIALKQGDAVGLMSFGSDQRWLPSQKGISHINTLLNHVYDLQPGPHASDYSAAAQKLVQMQRKRALVILITNTRDEDIDDLLPAIKMVSRNHLIMLANIREPILQQTLDTPVETIEQAQSYCGTVDYLANRQKVSRQLSDAGVFIVDTHPEHLPQAVCNRYLDIKRGGLL